MKIHIPPIQRMDLSGSLKIILDGIDGHPDLESCENEHDSDFIFLDFRHEGKYEINYPNKTIMIDYRDHHGALNVSQDILLYFKRSVVDKFPSLKRFHDYGARRVIPISYIVKGEAMNWDILPLADRGIDISMFFNPLAPLRGKDESRNRIARLLQARLSKNCGCPHPTVNLSAQYETFISKEGKSAHEGRNSIQKKYYNKMLNSRIVITCNPQRWEGDWRLFEAFSCSPLVMVDRMLTPVENSFVDGKHLIYYDLEKLDDLFNKIRYYIDHLDEAQTIATAGYNHALQYHTAKARMDEILKKINEDT